MDEAGIHQDVHSLLGRAACTSTESRGFVDRDGISHRENGLIQGFQLGLVFAPGQVAVVFVLLPPTLLTLLTCLVIAI